ncbi:MAG: ParB/RepB/Spo0J family partition protein [Lachnospiraceae bacterium]|nr:ParB/RepB/Spo0J family partition protein [Lachnospiraceae bacterium]MDY3223487.1 ParB/RepB/Spo0J family partition protein [Lachnospiraceae bacterium]
MAEKVMDIQMDKLVGFRNHPFQVKNDETLNALCESIRDYGVLSPLLARPTADGSYEIVSGHRRKAAAMKLGLEKLPVLVREMTDDEAVILMVDSNIQRENLLPSEKAYAYKMKLEAIKRQGARTDLTSCQVGTRFRSDMLVASDTNESARTIHRYIRLTYLQKPILDLVDEGRIAFSPAVELSYLTKLEQAELWDIMQSEDCTPSLSQAVRMKKLSKIAQLTSELIFDIMSEEKANQKERVRIDVSQLRKYFPKSYTTAQMEKSILRMLEEQYQRKQRSKEFR